MSTSKLNPTKYYIRSIILLPLVLAGITYLSSFLQLEQYECKALLFAGTNSGVEELVGIKKSNYSAKKQEIQNLIELSNSYSGKKDVMKHVLAQDISSTCLDSVKLSEPNYTVCKNISKNLFPDEHECDKDIIYAELTRTSASLFNGPYSLDKLSGVVTSQEKNKDMITVKFSHTDSSFCQYVVEGYSHFLTSTFGLVKNDQTARIIEFYSAKLKKAKNKLDSIEWVHSQYKQNENILDFDKQTAALINAEQNALYDAEASRINLAASEQLSRDYNLLLNSNTDKAFDKSEFIKNKNKLADLVEKISKEGEGNQDVQNKVNELKKILKKDIEKIQRSQGSLVNNKKSTLPVDISANHLAVSKNEVLAEEFNKQYRKYSEAIKSHALKESELKNIERVLVNYENQYQNVLTLYNASILHLETDELASELVVIDKAVNTIQKVSRVKWKSVVLAYVFGLLSILSYLMIKYKWPFDLARLLS
jgi:hypothetical protein